MSALGDLVIRLTADTAEARSDIGKTAAQVERDMEHMMTRASAAGNLIGQALGAIAGKFVDLAREAAKTGDELNKLSQRAGFTVERLSELKFAGELADVSFGQLQTGLGFFNKVLVDAQNEASKAGQLFRALGVDVTQGPQVAFEQFTAAINALPDGETKVAAMRLAFGRAGDALIPMISGLDEATEKAQRLGIVMSKQLAEDAERFNDTMTALSASSRALAINALTPMASGLATIAENLLEAKMKGEMFIGVLREIDKVVIATFGRLDPTGFFDRRAEQQFQYYNNRNTGGASGTWGTTPVPAPDQGQLNAILSGQRDPKAPKTPRGRVETDITAKQLQEGMQEEAKIMAEAAQLTDDFNRRQRESDQAVIDARNKSLIDAYEAEQERELAMSELRVKYEKSMTEQYTDEVKKRAREGEQFARSMGLVMVSAAEEAIRKWEGFGNLIKKIALDLAQVAFRKTVTEPLGAAVASGIGSIPWGKLFAGETWSDTGTGLMSVDGARADGGPVSAGGTYLVGERGPELFVPNASGAIVPNGGMRGGVVLNTRIDARGADPSVLPRIQQALSALGNQVGRLQESYYGAWR